MPTSQQRYERALEIINNGFAAFHKVGTKAYDPSLDTSRMLDDAFGQPSGKFRSIHIAGTNGKGSTAHTLAAILSSAGFRTGLYTSPHIVDFRERIRVDGEMITKDAVADFIERWNGLDLSVHASFFEMVTCMAFDYFARCGVDVAVIETGLGGRLDSTNIITPELSVITNISLDHTAILGNDLQSIAREKAGIIKHGVPVVIGEAEGEVAQVFSETARNTGSTIRFADRENQIISTTEMPDGTQRYLTRNFGIIDAQLSGVCQTRNAATILTAIDTLRQHGFEIPTEAVINGFADVCTSTGLMGRWSRLSAPGVSPVVIADTGHNPGGWKYLAGRLAAIPGPKELVIGFVADKDVATVLRMIASIPECRFHATAPSNERALPAAKLAIEAENVGINVADVSDDVMTAYRKAIAAAAPDATVFVGGSTFVVADLMQELSAL